MHELSLRRTRLFVVLSIIGVFEPLPETVADEFSPQFASPVVARVHDRPIHADEVQYFLPAELRGQPIAELEKDLWQAAVDLAIDRRLIVAALARRNKAASDQDIDVELARLGQRLARRESTLEAYLAQRPISLASFRHVLRWQLTWPRYLQQTVTDQNLARYFDRNRRDFDGTRLRVAHILWKRSADSAEERDRLRLIAAQVRQQIIAGELSFEDAAAAHSAAPTAQAGGEIGWISRHEPMSPEFHEAAFQLEINQISQPVVSSAGVHLIRCLAVESGQQTWKDVRADLTKSLRSYLFRWLADRERATAEIEIME